MKKKKLSILGSTGSIGTQALDVVRANRDLFEIEMLSAYNNIDLLTSQAKEFNPKYVVIANKKKYSELLSNLTGTDTQILAGHDEIVDIVQEPGADIILAAMVGYAGLLPTIKAIESGKDIALANKETLVVAGELIMNLSHQHDVNVLPVDSEHSAIFQCVEGENNPIEKVFLTASGGPFRNCSKDQLKSVDATDALKHPNWDMGAKVTIDSASLMNKGLEAIEAKWLFNLKPEQIDVVIHPQSIIHSMAQFEDGSIKAQLSLPDMRMPIQYALGYPKRIKSDFKRFNYLDYPQLTFEKPDIDRFHNLALAFESMKRGGNMPCIMNAANEITVAAFLQGKVGFLEMSEIVEKAMRKVTYLENPVYEDYCRTDEETRTFVNTLI